MANDVVRTHLLQKTHELQQWAKEAEEEITQFTPYESMLQGLWRELKTYQSGDDPHKAVYVLARCYTLMERWAILYQAISDYDEARAKLTQHDMRRTIENG